MSHYRVRMVAGGLLFSAMFVIYGLSAGPYAVPGISAGHIVMHLGLHPFSPLDHPLWGLCVRGLQWIPVSSLAHRLNLFSVLCGAGTVFLMFWLVSGIPHALPFGENPNPHRQLRARLISGVFAGLSLGFCIPFWSISTRAHPLSLDAFLLVGLMLLGLRVIRTRRTGWLYLFAFLFGAGITEFATLLTLLPVCMAVVLYAACADTRRVPLKRLGLAAGFFLLGTGLYAVTAWAVYQSPSADWRGWDSFGTVLIQVWKHQYFLLVKMVPRYGWLLIFLTTILPVTVVLLYRGGFRRGPGHASPLLFAVCSLTAVLVLLNTVLSPWGMLGWRPLIVTPYVLLALWAGYLAGFWNLYFMVPGAFELPFKRTLRRALGIMWIPVLAAFLLVCAVRNFPRVDTRGARDLSAWAHALVKACEDRSWLISSTGMEDLVLLANHEEGGKLHVVNPAFGSARSYRNYVGSLFENPRHKGLSQVGVGMVLVELLRTDASFAERVAVTTQADLLAAAGKTPMPFPMFFSDRSVPSHPDPQSLLDRHRRYWATIAPLFNTDIHPQNPLAGHRKQLRMVHSKLSNNLGVYLEEQARSDLAVTAYRMAREQHGENVSALLNLYALSGHLPPEESKVVEEAFNDLLDPEARYRLWSLSYHYGYVHHPEAYIQRGLAWAVSGKPRIGLRELRRALAMGRDNQRMQLSLAALYFANRQLEDSREIYQALLVRNPAQVSALRGLARIALLQGEYNTAREYLKRMQDVPAAAEIRLLEEAALEFGLGHLGRAGQLLDEVLALDAENAHAWAGKALLYARTGDDKALDAAMKQLRDAPQLSPELQLAYGQLLASRGQADDALQVLTNLVEQHVNHPGALEYLLRLRVRQGNRVETRAVMEKLLRVEPTNAYGNLVLGSIQYAHGEDHLAEASFSASVAADRTVEALNSLAWVLQRQGRVDEALPLVEEAISISPIDGPSHDTLAMIKFKQKEFEAAEQAALRALALQPNAIETLYHIALIYEAQEQYAAARSFIEKVSGRLGAFSPDQHDQVLEDINRIRKRRK